MKRSGGGMQVLLAAWTLAWTATDAWTQGAPQVDAQTRQIAALRSEVRAAQEDLQRLRAMLEATAQQNQALQADIRALREEVAKSGSGSSRDEAAASKRLDVLEEGLRTEARTREREIKEVIAAVAKEMEGTLQKLRPADGGRAERAASPTRGQTVYSVQRGDTLSAIAQAFKTTVQAIKEANQLQNDQIHPDQKLVIP